MISKIISELKTVLGATFFVHPALVYAGHGVLTDLCSANGIMLFHMADNGHIDSTLTLDSDLHIRGCSEPNIVFIPVIHYLKSLEKEMFL